MKENEIDLDEIAKEVTDAMKMELIGKLREEGNFKVKDDKIFSSEGKDNEIDVMYIIHMNSPTMENLKFSKRLIPQMRITSFLKFSPYF